MTSNPSTVLVVGAGGIGCPCATALVEAGVGRVVLVDFDVVEPSNLPRQVLFEPGDVGRPKATVAAERLGPTVEGVVARFDAATGPALLARCDVAVDATDGAASKDLVHALAVRAGRAFVHAAALGAEGRVLDVPAGGRPCLACTFGALSDGEGADTCASFGVWPGVTGAVGALAAAAALGRLAAPHAPSRGLRVLDLDGPRAVTLAVATDPACPVCGPGARDLAPIAAPAPRSEPAPVAVPAGALDLTQESCPMNMLRARRAVDALAPGRSLEIWLGDDGRESVPEGLAALGHEVLERSDAGEALRLVVRRRAPLGGRSEAGS